MSENKKLKIGFHSIVLRLGAYFAFLLLGYVGLAIFGIYSNSLAVMGFVVFIAAGIFFVADVLKSKKIIFDRFAIILLAVILGFCIFTGIFHHEMPRGRDDMSYIFSAVQIDKTSSLKFDDLLTRPFHGVRQISGDTYTSQFLPAYSTYLSALFKMGGMNLLYWGNAILLFFSLYAIYGVALLIANKRTGLIAVLFFIAFYSSYWFLRRTYSENLLLMLIWLGFYYFINSYKYKKNLPAWLGFSVIVFSMLARLEGLFMAIVALPVLIYLLVRNRKHTAQFKQYKNDYYLALIPISAVILYFFYYKFYGGYDYVFGQFQMFSVLVNSARSIFLIVIGLSLLGILFITCRLKKWSVKKMIGLLALVVLAGFEIYFFYKLSKSLEMDWGIYRKQYVLENFFFYGLIPFVLIALIGFFTKFYKRSIFILLFLASPASAFFIEAGIGPDQPWYMRRFLPVIIPLIFVMAAVIVGNLKVNKKQLVGIGAVLVILNLAISYPLVFFREHKGIDAQLAKFSKNFHNNDLILMMPGWKWQQWAYAWHYVYGLNIIPTHEGFREIKEFQKLINRYDNVYILSSRGNDLYPYYSDDNAELISGFSLKYDELVSTSTINSYVQKNSMKLAINEIRLQQEGTPPQQITEVEENLSLYKVKDKNDIRVK